VDTGLLIAPGITLVGGLVTGLILGRLEGDRRLRQLRTEFKQERAKSALAEQDDALLAIGTVVTEIEMDLTSVLYGRYFDWQSAATERWRASEPSNPCGDRTVLASRAMSSTRPFENWSGRSRMSMTTRLRERATSSNATQTKPLPRQMLSWKRFAQRGGRSRRGWTRSLDD